MRLCSRTEIPIESGRYVEYVAMMRAIIGVAAPINRLAARATTNRLAALRTSTRLLSTKRPFSSEVAVDSASTPPSDAAVLSSLMAGDMPHHRLEAELGDAARAAQLRRLYLEATAAAAGAPVSFEGLPLNGMDTDNFYSSIVGQNCENVVGYVPLPVGIVGPLLVDGRSYQVPLATTEGALIASTNRGARAVSQCGGVTSVLLDDGMTRAPLVACVDLSQAAAMKAYCEAPESLAELQSIFSGSTRFGQLLSVKVALGRPSRVFTLQMRDGRRDGDEHGRKGRQQSHGGVDVAIPWLRANGALRQLLRR